MRLKSRRCCRIDGAQEAGFISVKWPIALIQYTYIAAIYIANQISGFPCLKISGAAAAAAIATYPIVILLIANAAVLLLAGLMEPVNTAHGSHPFSCIDKDLCGSGASRCRHDSRPHNRPREPLGRLESIHNLRVPSFA